MPMLWRSSLCFSPFSEHIGCLRPVPRYHSCHPPPPQAGSNEWHPMTNSYGAVWEASKLPALPFDLRLTNEDGASIVLKCARRGERGACCAPTGMEAGR
jgi:hypothetical protein